MSINPCRHTRLVLDFKDEQAGRPRGYTLGNMMDGGFACSICYPNFSNCRHPSEVFPDYFDEDGKWVVQSNAGNAKQLPYEQQLREACRLYWAVKGHIPAWLKTASYDALESQIDSYTKRLWNNNEAYLHFEGFEEAYEVFRR